MLVEVVSPDSFFFSAMGRYESITSSAISICFSRLFESFNNYSVLGSEQTVGGNMPESQY